MEEGKLCFVGSFQANCLSVEALNVSVVAHAAQLCSCLLLLFFFDSAAQVLKVEQGEKYPPFVLDSVFQISDDEGRG